MNQSSPNSQQQNTASSDQLQSPLTSGEVGQTQTDGIPPANQFTVYLYERVKIYTDPFHTHYAGTTDRLMATNYVVNAGSNTAIVENISAHSSGTVMVGGDQMMFYLHDNTSTCKYFYRVDARWNYTQSTEITYLVAYGPNDFAGIRNYTVPAAPPGTYSVFFDEITDLPTPSSNSEFPYFNITWQY
jgi:hypothetical protein